MLDILTHLIRFCGYAVKQNKCHVLNLRISLSKIDFPAVFLLLCFSYIFLSIPFTTLAKSDPASGFITGKVQITVLDGTLEVVEPLVNTTVSVIAVAPDGRHSWLMQANSDENGVVNFDVPLNIDLAGIKVEAYSRINGKVKHSELITVDGQYQFVVGNLPVMVSLIDDLTDKPLVGEVLVVHKLNDQGAKLWFAEAITDETGMVILDLDNMDEGAEYVVSASIYNGFTQYSEVINAAGSIEMRFGSTRIKVISGSDLDLPPIVNTPVTFYQLDEHGNKRYYTQINTDNYGMLRVDLPELTKGQTYILGAHSMVSGKEKFSMPITQPGDHQVRIGNLPLFVMLQDFHSRKPITEQPIAIYRLQNDGGREFMYERITDSAGRIQLDLNGLGAGVNYQLGATVYNLYNTLSQPITDTGFFIFNVGTTALQLVDGSNNVFNTRNNLLANHEVDFYHTNGAGETLHYASLYTDDDGWIRADFPVYVENGRLNPFTMKAKSHVDGITFYEKDLKIYRTNDMKIGSQPVVIRLIDTTSGNVMPHHVISIYEAMADESFAWYRQVKSGADGTIMVDLPGLADGKQYRLTTTSLIGTEFNSALIVQPGEFNFSIGNPPVTVTLVDDLSNQAIANHPLEIYRIMDDGSRVWFTDRQTDKNGRVVLDLDGIKSGTSYVVAAQVYNGFLQYSDILRPGEMEMRFGTTRISIINASVEDKPPLRNTEVTLYQLDQYNHRVFFDQVMSDDQGLLRLDLPDLDNGQSYMISAKSVVSGKEKYSQPIHQCGDYTVNIGNLPLYVLLQDLHSRQPVNNQNISIYKLSDTGNREWLFDDTTDDAGRLQLDLEGFDTGTTYQLAAQVYNDHQSLSDLITENGYYTFNVGTTVLQLLDGADPQHSPLPYHEVDIYREASVGDSIYVTSLRSDAVGEIRIDLPEMYENGRLLAYSAIAKSHIDELTYYESELQLYQTTQLKVGSQPVTISLNDAITGNRISDHHLAVYELSEDGTGQYYMQVMSGRQGSVVLDLPNIAEGKQYYLTTMAFSGTLFTSTTIHSPGLFDFNIGDTAVTIKNGSLAGNPVMPLTNVVLYLANESQMIYLQSVTTNEFGVARFDLNAGSMSMNRAMSSVFRLMVKSPVNGKYKYSQNLTEPGTHQFVVGNPEVNVHLTNVLTGESYANQQVAAYLMDENQQPQWVISDYTDDYGMVKFDLDGLSEGFSYIFSTSLFASGQSYSAEINTPGDVAFQVGEVPVTLWDITTGEGMVNKSVIAYRVLENGDTEWITSGLTDSDGKIVFDLGLVHRPARIMFKAQSPFGEGNVYYGPIISNVGMVDFYIKKGHYGELDTEKPLITMDSPFHAVADASGFVAAGDYDDNVGVGLIEVTLADPINGEQILVANVNEDSGRWYVNVVPEWLSLDEWVTITVDAYDYSLNKSTIVRHYQIRQDQVAPSIEVLSHQPNDRVNMSGFILNGLVVDDIGVESIYASLVDNALGETLVSQPLDFDQESGLWTLIVTSGYMAANSQVNVTLIATDTNGKVSELDLELSAFAVEVDPLQLVERISFGMDHTLLSQIKSGVDILATQLDPDSIDDDEFESQMAQKVINSKTQLKDYLVTYMIGSKKQLREVMAWFWENHFNTDINTHGQVHYELAENQLFREHALGNFRTLLDISAKSPAMVRYLNNQQNVAGRANENYAREIMELHTMGVNGGYDAHDVAELSKIFTGWHEENGEFVFNGDLHDSDDKEFLDHYIYGGGIEEGEYAMDILATHPATAQFICGKLITLFVSDNKQIDLQQQCAAEFLASQGDIKSILMVILTSEVFAAVDNYRDKVKTPLELMVATARGFAGEYNPRLLNQEMANMGMNLFEYALPTGFSEYGSDWLNSNAVLQRIAMVNRAAWQLDDVYTIDIYQVVQDRGLRSAEEIIGWLFELALGNLYSEFEHQVAKDILMANGGFNLHQVEAKIKLQRLLATVLSFPSYQQK